jgi:histidinol-phosphatase (PHP family)
MKNETSVNVLPDYHLHTFLCKHASGGAAEYKGVAQNRGVVEICFADHCPTPDGYDPDIRMDMEQFPEYREMVAAQQGKGSPKVLFGIEADYYEGCERFLRQWLPNQGFDFILGSVHYIEDWGFDNPGQRHVWDSVDVTATWRKYFELIGRLVDLGLFDAISHIDLPKKFGYRPPDRALKEMAGPILDRIAKADMGMELNTSGLRRPIGEIYGAEPILSMAREREIPICFGSDAHSPEEVGAGFASALTLAREVGYTHYFRMKHRKKELIPLPEAPPVYGTDTDS